MSDVDTLESMALAPTRADSAGGCDPSLASALLAGVPTALVKAIVSGCETRELQAGDRLLTAGQDNDTLYLVLSGALGVHLSEASRPVIRLVAGDCAGELSLLDGFGASADVVAQERSLVLGIDREQLWHFVEQSPAVARNLLRILAGRVRNDNAMLQEAARVQRTLENAATIDALTGLRNRRWLNEAFDRQLQRSIRSSRQVSLLMVDTDHFKRINDTYGHVVGDEVLVSVGRALAGELRPADLLARYGGEEFAIMLADVPHASALLIADRVRRAVEAAPTTTSAGVLPAPVTVSVGVATATPDAPLPLQALIDRADRLLAHAKAAGRNCVRG